MPDPEEFPPTQYLMLEVLAARWRLGEVCWTFPSRLRPQARALAAAGLVGWKSGVTEGSIRLWLTDAGRTASMIPDYTPPIDTGSDEAAGANCDETWLPAGTGVPDPRPDTDRR